METEKAIVALEHVYDPDEVIEYWQVIIYSKVIRKIVACNTYYNEDEAYSMYEALCAGLKALMQ